MLSIEPARSPQARVGKIGIALAGGGPLGAFYELGALHALSEAIVGRELTGLDVYVGVSSGSLAAAGLANGFDTTALGSIFIHEGSTLAAFSPGMLLQPAIGEYLRRASDLPWLLAMIARRYALDPLHSNWSTAIGPLARALPTAIFDNKPLERFLHRLFGASGHTDDFRQLRSRLFVVATNLNSGQSVCFGDSGHDRVPISRAIIASAALPGLYAAVEIDHEHYVDGALVRTLHASLALEEGCDLVICINPLVPFDASHRRAGRHANLANEGLPAILGQTFRAIIHSRMQVGMASYAARFPHADMVLLEPDRHDERLFFANVFRYSGRQHLVEHAYQRTRRDLLSQHVALGAVLARRGLALDLRVLRDRRRTFVTAARDRARHRRRVAPRLRRALHRLEGLLSDRDLERMSTHGSQPVAPAARR
jgi:predicted acylesterase/phospholipase RssA